MKVLPVEGRAVRDPRNMQLLPPEGREVPDTDSFWARRVLDGDVTVEAPPEMRHGQQRAPHAPHREA